MPTVDELMDQGIKAYRERDFASAIEKFQHAIDLQSDLWIARLYVAMCHYKNGMVFMAANHFRHIRDNCPDAEIRTKAEVALAPVNRESSEITMSNFTKPLPGKGLSVPDDDDGALVEWTPSSTT